MQVFNFFYSKLLYMFLLYVIIWELFHSFDTEGNLRPSQIEFLVLHAGLPYLQII